MPHRQKAHLDCLDQSLQKITVKKDWDIIVCGVFNFPDIDCDTHTISADASDRQVQQQLVDLAEKYNLYQMQDLPTLKNNMLDLVFTTNPTRLKSTANAPGLSDHDIVIIDFCVKPFHYFRHVKPPKNATYSARLTGKHYVKQQQRHLRRRRSC